MATSLGTVIVGSPRMRELADWYREVFALGEWERFPGHLGQRVGEVWFGIDEKDRADSGSGVVAWFHVDDLDAAFARAVASGCTVLFPPTAKPFGYVLASVRDPDGNAVGLARKRPATS